MAKILKIKGFFEFEFYCPGCRCNHGFRTRAYKMPEGLSAEYQKSFNKSKWTFDGDYDSPTIHPSVRVYRTIIKKDETICHFWMKKGMIQYLTDSKHKLKGKTIKMQEI